MPAKKNTFVILLTIFLVCFFSTYLKGGLCSDSNVDCLTFSTAVFATSISVFIALLFSALSYFMREEVFRAWMKFTAWWMPLTFVLILFGAAGGSSSLLNLGAILTLLMPVIYFITSVFVIYSTANPYSWDKANKK